MRNRIVPVLLAWILVAPCTAQQVFVVDASGGPGSHFTDLPTAVAAVPAASILRLRPGQYAPIPHLTKGLSILGEDRRTVLVEIGAPTRFGPLPPGQDLVLASFTWNAPTLIALQPAVEISDVPSTTLLDDIGIDLGAGLVFLARPLMTVVRCGNAHFHRFDIPANPGVIDSEVPAFSIENSTVQITRSSFVGLNGAIAISQFTGKGGPGVRVGNASHVSFSSTRCTGGAGADTDIGSIGAYAGIGGDGVVVQDHSRVTFYGDAATLVQGGPGGQFGTNPTLAPARAGDGITVRRSSIAEFFGFAPSGGSPTRQVNCSSGCLYGPPGVASNVDPSSTLRIDAQAQPPLARLVRISGATPPRVRFEVSGQPSAHYLLMFGFRATHIPFQPTDLGALFISPILFVGPYGLDSNGQGFLEIPVDFDFPKYRPIHAQFLVSDPSPLGFRLSNSVVALELE